ncbi:transposase [Jatrophihabitans sp.]|uniref:transposase n=1 Tax=Jatrophihabitans sp. TaxID=1932789 RepID=UPI002EFE1722
MASSARPPGLPPILADTLDVALGRNPSCGSDRVGQRGPAGNARLMALSETRKYRTFTPEQKIEIVPAGLRGDRPVRDVCRECEISEALFYQWRERLLEGGQTALATPRDKKPPEAAELAKLQKKVAQLERALGRKTYEIDKWGSRPHPRSYLYRAVDQHGQVILVRSL